MLTKIRHKFSLFLKKDEINKCILFLNSGCFSHFIHWFRQNVIRSTDPSFKQQASNSQVPSARSVPMPHISASHHRWAHQLSPKHSQFWKLVVTKANLSTWQRGGNYSRLGRGREGEAGPEAELLPWPRMTWPPNVTPLAWMERGPLSLFNSDDQLQTFGPHITLFCHQDRAQGSPNLGKFSLPCGSG